MNTDLVIIGGGIIGLYTAYTLLGDNLKLTIVEQGELGQQSSWASGGILTPLLPWHYNQAVNNLVSGVDLIFEKQASTLFKHTDIDIEFWRCGMKIIDHKELSSAKKWALKHKLDLSITEEGFYLPRTAQVRSPRLIQALIQYLKSHDVTLLTNTTFNKLNIKKNTINGISTSNGEISTDKVVFAGGASKQNSTEKHQHYHLPAVVPVLGQIIAFSAPDICLETILYADGYYLIPRKDGNILVGSTLEHNVFEQKLSLTGRDQLKQAAFSILPVLKEYPIVHHWSGIRPGSENNFPTIGPHPTIKGLYLNSGHFRYGVAMAPRSAEILRGWILTPDNALNDATYLMEVPV